MRKLICWLKELLELAKRRKTNMEEAVELGRVLIMPQREKK